ncbi:hypothetical protein [Nocardia sp. NPDC050435]|uniref:hypothetical protein n=1 Tax=Nocardia sp. NPDC050435 TaxID=3155040 RepID=UPI0033F19CAA
MAESKRVRWECPNGKHPGVLGSRRPRLKSIVRYCLPCSEAAGELVERVAPTLERERAASAARSAEKAKGKRKQAATTRQRQKDAETERYTVEGVDLRDEFKRLIRLRAFGGLSGRLYRNPPEFAISRRKSMPRSQFGLAYPYENRIIVATWPGIDLADARETLVHELTHIAVGQDRSDTRAWHGAEFTKRLDAAFKEAYKVTPKGVRHNRYHGRYAAALRAAAVPSSSTDEQESAS